MNCDERRILIEQLLDGELPPTESSSLEKHIRNCPPCQLYSQKIQDEQTIYGSYHAQRVPLELPPQLWNSIERQTFKSGKTLLNPSAREGWRDWLGKILIGPRMNPIAVAVLLIISISLTVLFLRRPPKPNQREVEIAQVVKQQSTPAPNPAKITTPLPIEPQKVISSNTSLTSTSAAQKRMAKSFPSHLAARKLTPRELVKRAEENYRAAIVLLERDFKRRPTPMDEKTREQFQIALAALDKNIVEMRKAASRYPDDPQTIQYMLIAYAHKVDLLEEMVSY